MAADFLSLSITEDPTRVDSAAAIGSLIFRRRRELGMTQVQLAARLGIHHGTIAHLERARNSPSIAMLLRILNALDLDLWAFAKDGQR